MQSTIPLKPKIEIDGAHKYFISGAPTTWPSVTAVLDEVIDKSGPLVWWSANQALGNVRQKLLELSGKDVRISEKWIENLIQESRKKPEEAKKAGGDRGTLFHEAADNIMRGKPHGLTGELAHMGDSFGEWLKKKKTKLMAAEIPVASFEHEYVGKFDTLVETSEGIELWDYKTANKGKNNKMYPDTGVYNKDAFQLGAYALAIRETLDISVTRARIIWINKDALEYADCVVDNLDYAVQGFLKARNG